MIELTRLNGSKMLVNCDLLKYAEASPDTVLTLTTGEKILVRETCAEVAQRTLTFHASVLSASQLRREANSVAGTGQIEQHSLYSCA